MGYLKSDTEPGKEKDKKAKDKLFRRALVNHSVRTNWHRTILRPGEFVHLEEGVASYGSQEEAVGDEGEVEDVATESFPLVPQQAKAQRMLQKPLLPVLSHQHQAMVLLHNFSFRMVRLSNIRRTSHVLLTAILAHLLPPAV